jgi:hypothetical protein
MEPDLRRAPDKRRCDHPIYQTRGRTPPSTQTVPTKSRMDERRTKEKSHLNDSERAYIHGARSP